MHFLEPQFQNFPGGLPNPPIKGGSHPLPLPRGSDKTTPRLGIVGRLLIVNLLLQTFRRAVKYAAKITQVSSWEWILYFLNHIRLIKTFLYSLIHWS